LLIFEKLTIEIFSHYQPTKIIEEQGSGQSCIAVDIVHCHFNVLRLCVS